MSPATVAGGFCLLVAAGVVLWPGPGARARHRRLVPGRSVPLSAGRLARITAAMRAAYATVALAGGSRVAPVCLVIAGAAAATAVAGIVAGVAVAVYGALAARALTRHRAARTGDRFRAEVLDDLAAASADLRAGLPADRALPDPSPTPDRTRPPAADPLLSRVGAARQLAERTGAPLADLIERIEADARSVDRARATAAAQAAGSRATAYLLAGLPVGGILLGFAIGADPLAVLLHTPLGAACAFGAIILQLAGLAWAGRLTAGGVAAR